MALRAVFFDIDDTLFATSAFASLARQMAVEAMVDAGLQVPVDEARAELDAVVREFSSNYDRHFDQLVQRLSDRLAPGVHPAVVIASGVIGYHAAKAELRPFPDAVMALETLGRSDLLLGVITNGLTVKQAEKLVRLGLADAFTPGGIFISEEIGVAKPHPKIFHVACERFSVDPGECLYVGDNPVKDVDPAHEAGLLTCLRRGDGRHADAPGVHEPDIVVDDLMQLVEALGERFGIRCG